MTVTRTEAAGTQCFSLDDEEPLAAGERPAALAEPRGHEKVMRHIANVMEYMPVVQILDVPVPQMVDSVPVTDRILQHNMDQIGGYVVEQLVVVPKLSTQTRISAPAFVPEPLTAEQLVNVPVLSFDDCFLVLQVVLSFPFFLLLPWVSFIFSCSQFFLYFLFVKNVFLLFF